MSARDIALIMIDRFDLPEWPAGALASLKVRPYPFDLRDQQLASRIAMEATRNLLLINHLIVKLSDRKMNKIDPVVRKIIGIALVQMLFLDRIPPSAAVDEAVEQTKRFGKKSASGFVNAILRKATRDRIVLPEDPTIGLSHPKELVDRLREVLGEQNLLAMCRHNQSRPPTILRLAPGVTMAQLQTEGVTLTAHERPGFIVIQPTVIDLLVQWSTNNLAQAQDPTAGHVVEFCDIQPGMSVLDRCCGMGTKTMQLQERLGNTGTLVAIDRSDLRVDNLRAIAQHRDYKNLHAIFGSKVADAEPWVPENGFDRVLADVPCSNSGVLARRSMAKYFQDDASLGSLCKLQFEILNDTAPAVASDGLLIYSTCSIWREENETMVEAFLGTHPEFTRERQQTTLPSFETEVPAKYHDGGYVAVLKKNPRPVR